MNLVFTEVCVMVVLLYCVLCIYLSPLVINGQYVDGCCVYLCVYCHFVCVLKFYCAEYRYCTTELNRKIAQKFKLLSGNTITTKVK